MPSIHIGEAVFDEWVNQEGGYSEAKDAIKDHVRKEVEE